MIQRLHDLYLFLYKIDPAVPFAAMVLLVFFVVYGLRKLLPKQWELIFGRFVPVDEDQVLLELLSKAWQSLPGQIFGAVTAAVASGGNVKVAAFGALAGAAASVSHEILKALPIPYQGATGVVTPPPQQPPQP